VEFYLPEPVETTCSDIAEIEDSRPRPPEGKTPGYKGLEVLEVEIAMVTDIIRKPCTEKTSIQVIGTRNSDPIPVEESTFPLFGLEQFAKERIINHPFTSPPSAR
jgi:hypothetical protein